MAKSQKDSELIEIVKGFENVPWSEQYERMISGMLYDCMDPILVAGRHRARLLQHQYNNYFPLDSTPSSLVAEKEKMLKNIFGKIGKDCFIESLQVDYGCNISVGDRFYANYNLVVLDCSLVTIGDRVMIGPNVSIYAATHETAIESRRANIEYASTISIGSDCWIGGNVVIVAGVHIGEGCTIGAGAVVTKNVPPYSVAVGNPARVIKQVERPKEDL